MSITVGPITLQEPVLLAPMSGVTDLPFRRLVKRHGAGLVVSEMIASEAMIRQTLDAEPAIDHAEQLLAEIYRHKAPKEAS